MAKVEVKAKTPKTGKEAAILVDLGENATNAISLFGDAVVFSNYLANQKVHIQAGMRRYLDAGKSQDEIQKLFDSYRPGVTMDRVVDPVAALANRLAKLPPEEQIAMIEELRKKAALIAGAQAPGTEDEE